MTNESAATSIDREHGFTTLAGASYRFEEPDLMVTVLTGELTYETVDALCVASERWAAGKPYFLSLTHLRSSHRPHPAARKRGTETLRTLHLRGTALVGGSPQARALSAMVFRGVALLSARARASPVRFFGTEAEARAWLAERRAEIQREEESGKSSK